MSDNGLPYHDFASMFPMMDDERLIELRADIREHGLHEPITLYQGKILDGRNRSLACMMESVKPHFRTFDGDDLAALNYVMSLNVKRRDLSKSQRATAAREWEKRNAAIMESMRAEAKERIADGQRKGGETAGKGRPKDSSTQKVEESYQEDRNERTTDAKLADMFGTNRAYISMARAIDKNDPELFEKVKTGEKSLGTERENLYPRDRPHKKPPAPAKPPAVRVTEKRAEKLSSLSKRLDDAINQPPFKVSVGDIRAVWKELYVVIESCLKGSKDVQAKEG